MPIETLAAITLLAAAAANAWMARRLGRTAAARWLGFAIYTLALLVLVGVLLLVALGARSLLALTVDGALAGVAAAARRVLAAGGAAGRPAPAPLRGSLSRPGRLPVRPIDDQRRRRSGREPDSQEDAQPKPRQGRRDQQGHPAPARRAWLDPGRQRSQGDGALLSGRLLWPSVQGLAEQRPCLAVARIVLDDLAQDRPGVGQPSVGQGGPRGNQVMTVWVLHRLLPPFRDCRFSAPQVYVLRQRPPLPSAGAGCRTHMHEVGSSV
jgi:hypothetical protein